MTLPQALESRKGKTAGAAKLFRTAYAASSGDQSSVSRRVERIPDEFSRRVQTERLQPGQVDQQAGNGGCLGRDDDRKGDGQGRHMQDADVPGSRHIIVGLTPRRAPGGKYPGDHRRDGQDRT